MRIITVDFETFWAKDHSLSKMSPIDYVMHPDTELISMALKEGNGVTDVVFGEDKIRKMLSRIYWGDVMLLGHNMSGFDAMILAWRLGINPKMWGCTLAMARPIHDITVGKSLAKLVAHYEIGVKDQAVLYNTQGKHLSDFSAEELAAMKEYNKADVEQCYALFHKLKPHYDAKELWHIDATIRMLVEPRFDVDVPMLETALSMERDQKRKHILMLARHLRTNDMIEESEAVSAAETIEELEEAVRAELASAPKFSKLLESLGVETPMKDSPTNPDKQVPALAKTDEGFTALVEHENELVSAAARARLAVKSTLLETRLQAFIGAAEKRNGKFPVPLNYCGAVTTGRWSGFLYNPQNMPRVMPGKPKVSDALRNCLKAPPGHKVVVADLSGIELRVNMFLWKVPYAVELFKASPGKADLYKTLASEVLGVPYDEIQKMQRQAGKAMHLGCGFGLGSAEKFIAVAKTMAQIDVTEDEAVNYIAGYREKHPEIVQGWRTCHARLRDISSGVRADVDPWGLCVTCEEGIRLPSGRLIRYPALHQEPDPRGKQEWWYGMGRFRSRIYAGKVTENCVQALARDIVADNALDTYKATGYRPVLSVHDELAYVVPDKDAQMVLDTLQSIMRTPPKWWPELVTWSEGDIGDRYGYVK